MPIAQKFKALGAGNGFPSCVGKLDVSDYDYWTTLSGVNKDNPDASPELIQESLELAMKLFWNLNGVTGTLGGGGTAITVDLDEGDFDGATWYNADTAEYVRGVNKLPHERACYSEWAASTGFVSSDDFGTPSDGVRASGKIYRMYNDGNFVGYGGAGFGFESIGLFETFALTAARHRDYNDTTSYVDFDGMSFVGYYDAPFIADGYTTVSISSGTTATVTLSYDSGSSAVAGSLSSPTFYTYPQT